MQKFPPTCTKYFLNLRCSNQNFCLQVIPAFSLQSEFSKNYYVVPTQFLWIPKNPTLHKVTFIIYYHNCSPWCVRSIRLINSILDLSVLSTHRWCYQYVAHDGLSFSRRQSPTNFFFFYWYRTKIIQPEHLQTFNDIKNKSVVEQSLFEPLKPPQCKPCQPNGHSNVHTAHPHALDAVNYILLRIVLNLMSYRPNALYVSVHILWTIKAARHTTIV